MECSLATRKQFIHADEGKNNVPWVPQCKYGYERHLYMSLDIKKLKESERWVVPYVIASETK